MVGNDVWHVIGAAFGAEAPTEQTASRVAAGEAESSAFVCVWPLKSPVWAGPKSKQGSDAAKRNRTVERRSRGFHVAEDALWHDATHRCACGGGGKRSMDAERGRRTQKN